MLKCFQWKQAISNSVQWIWPLARGWSLRLATLWTSGQKFWKKRWTRIRKRVKKRRGEFNFLCFDSAVHCEALAKQWRWPESFTSSLVRPGVWFLTQNQNLISGIFRGLTLFSYLWIRNTKRVYNDLSLLLILHCAIRDFSASFASFRWNRHSGFYQNHFRVYKHRTYSYYSPSSHKATKDTASLFSLWKTPENRVFFYFLCLYYASGLIKVRALRSLGEAVEMAGIEPASNTSSIALLRA